MLKIAEIMRGKGITRAGLAKELGTNQKQIRRYLAKGYDPKLSTLIKIAQALGVKSKDLYTE